MEQVRLRHVLLTQDHRQLALAHQAVVAVEEVVVAIADQVHLRLLLARLQEEVAIHQVVLLHEAVVARIVQAVLHHHVRVVEVVAAVRQVAEADK